MISITAAFASDVLQIEKEMTVDKGTSAQAVFDLLSQEYPEIKGVVTYGVYGRRVSKDYLLCSGDRLELYQALLVDPKEQRRRRAIANKVQSNSRRRRSRPDQ